jgi:hypothetical protein
MRRSYIAVAVILWEICCIPNSVSQTTYAFGAGTDSCGAYLSNIVDVPGQSIGRIAPDDGRDYYSKSTVYLEWLLGFISGHNATPVAARDQVQIDAAAADLYVRDWCSRNLSSNVFTAIRHFLDRTDP